MKCAEPTSLESAEYTFFRLIYVFFSLQSPLPADIIAIVTFKGGVHDMAKIELLQRIDALASLLNKGNLSGLLSAECETELRTVFDSLTDKYIEKYCS